MNVVCHSTIAESKDGLFYQARPMPWEHCWGICPTRQGHQSMWCSDSFLVLKSRSIECWLESIFRLVWPSLAFHHVPYVLTLFHVNIAITCKPLANARLGFANCSMIKAAAILNNVTFSMECPPGTSSHTRAHGECPRNS